MYVVELTAFSQEASSYRKSTLYNESLHNLEHLIESEFALLHTLNDNATAALVESTWPGCIGVSL